MLICVIGCSFEFGSILRFFALLASLARGDLLHFCHGGGGVERGSCEFAQASLVVFAGRSSS